jgi:hypothetical protein
MKTLFPEKVAVWSGAILGGIVNATMTAQSAFYGALAQWIRNHYVLKGADGREGVITFAGGHWYSEAPLVGVFHNVHSDRFFTEKEQDLERFFNGCPWYQRSLAEQAALPYLQLEFEGRLLHRVTAAFWDQGTHLAAADGWEEILANGASLIYDELVGDPEAILARLQTSYDMSIEQVAFARSLFQRKMVRPPALIELTAAEADWLASTSSDATAMEACRQLFKGMDILLPDTK